MYSYFFPTWDSKKKKEVTPSLHQRLKKKILDEYINLPFYKKALLGIGFEGLSIAQQYVEDFEKDWPPEIILFEEILHDIRQPLGEGKLKNSKNLRAILAEGLCESMGFRKEEIEAMIKRRSMKNPFSSFSYEDYKLMVTLDLIFEKQHTPVAVTAPQPWK